VSFTLRDLQRTGFACINCNHKDRPLHRIPKAACPDLRACGACLFKFPGLCQEADRIFAAAISTQAKENHCGHCGGMVVFTPAQVRQLKRKRSVKPAIVVCTDCERDLRSLHP
jgi:hypothetical protein